MKVTCTVPSRESLRNPADLCDKEEEGRYTQIRKGMERKRGEGEMKEKKRKKIDDRIQE